MEVTGFETSQESNLNFQKILMFSSQLWNQQVWIWGTFLSGSVHAWIRGELNLRRKIFFCPNTSLFTRACSKTGINYLFILQNSIRDSKCFGTRLPRTADCSFIYAYCTPPACNAVPFPIQLNTTIEICFPLSTLIKFLLSDWTFARFCDHCQGGHCIWCSSTSWLRQIVAMHEI